MKTVLFQQLHVFLAVARLQRFRGAARELGVSTAAVSQSVRQLEKDLRVVLLNRTTRSVALTDAGRRLVENAGPGLAQAAAALHGVSTEPGEAVGRLRLSVPSAAVPYLITPVLPTFRTRHPRVEVDVVVEERLVDIVAEGYDAGVRLSEPLERAPPARCLGVSAGTAERARTGSPERRPGWVGASSPRLAALHGGGPPPPGVRGADMPLRLVKRLARDWFLLGMLCAVVLAALFPEFGASGGPMHADVVADVGIFAVFLLHGLGLPAAQLRAGVVTWRVHVVVQTFTFVVFPLLWWLGDVTVGRWLPSDLSLGLLYLCAVPSTISSSVAMTGAARGNVPPPSSMPACPACWASC